MAVAACGVKEMVAERFGIHEQVAELHSMLAEYHRKLAKEARLDIVHDITSIWRSG